MLARGSPWASNRAHEKSRRSLMFTEMEVRCSTRPICSAIPMNLRTRVSGGGSLRWWWAMAEHAGVWGRHAGGGREVGCNH